MSMDLAADILVDLEFITTWWPDLLEARKPGTPRPWRQALIDPERRAAIADRDRVERLEADVDAPGYTAAPQNVAVLDTIVDTWLTIDHLVAVIKPYVAATNLPGIDVRRVTDIDDMVTFVQQWLPTAVEGTHDLRTPGAERAVITLAKLARTLAQLVTRISQTLGIIRGGQVLAGALCPFCLGRDPKHPAGGATTLRIEEIDKSGLHGVVCWNTLCDPSSEQCGRRYRGRPAWPWHEWEWLAPQLITADRPAPLVAPQPRHTIDPVDHSGRSGLARERTAS